LPFKILYFFLPLFIFLPIDMLKNKSIVNDDLGYYGVPYQAVKLFIQTCPLVSNCSTDAHYRQLVLLMHAVISFYFVSQCVPNKVILKQTKMQPLNMILSKKCGSRFQMDLI
jgi:hypothetical protein